MSMKFYVVLLIVLLLFCLSVPVIATCEGDPPGNPYCYECDDGVWVLKVWANCGQDSDCTGECHGGRYTYLCTCSDDQRKCTGECHTCSAGSCTDDNNKCGGECGNCVNGLCDGCNANNCEECKFGLCVSRCDWRNCYACNGSGTCVYQCTSCELCASGGICVDCDSDITSPCSWTYPPVQSGCPGQTVDDLSCHPLDIGKSCHWVITDIIQLWNDVCPCCTLDTTSCVELTPWKCDNEFKITMGWVCHCDSESIGTPVYRGSGTKCPIF
jgi:hypothetical protein